MPASRMRHGVTKSGSPTPSEITFSICCAISKKRRMPDGGQLEITWLRGVGRLILRPWRKTRSYGFLLMGLTVALIVLFDLGLEPFATQVKKFWFWAPTRAGIYWYSTPWVNFFAWAGTGLLILAFATPTLINKKPVSQPPDFHPLIIWLLVSLLFATGAIANRLWAAAAVIVAHSLITAIFAVRGAAW